MSVLTHIARRRALASLELVPMTYSQNCAAIIYCSGRKDAEGEGFHVTQQRRIAHCIIMSNVSYRNEI